MRIAMISYHSSPLAALGGKTSGGMNVYVGELSAQLGRMGHQIDVFTRAPSFERKTLAPGVELVVLPAGLTKEPDKAELAGAIPEFSEAMLDFATAQNYSYDLVHAHYWMSGLVGKAVKEAWSVPMVLMFHTLGLVKNRIEALGERESDERIRGERAAMAAADMVVAATPAEQADLQWLYELHSDKVTVIPPGVDLKKFQPMPKEQCRTALGLSYEEKLLLFVGRLDAIKGIETLIRALARIKVPKPKVWIIGGENGAGLEVLGSEMARLGKLTAELGLGEKIEFLGSRNQEELPIYYAAADAVVMPSYSESFGLVALEAMACGRPVIASRVGGLAYLVEDGVNGFHVQEGDDVGLAERLQTLIGGEEIRERLGKAARAVAEKYSWQVQAQQIAELYRRLIIASP